MKRETMYAVVRHSIDGYDWIDTETLAYLPDISKSRANDTDSKIPGWSEANKQIRTIQVTITPLA